MDGLNPDNLIYPYSVAIHPLTYLNVCPNNYYTLQTIHRHYELTVDNFQYPVVYVCHIVNAFPLNLTSLKLEKLFHDGKILHYDLHKTTIIPVVKYHTFPVHHFQQQVLPERVSLTILQKLNDVDSRNMLTTALLHQRSQYVFDVYFRYSPHDILLQVAKINP